MLMYYIVVFEFYLLYLLFLFELLVIKSFLEVGGYCFCFCFFDEYIKFYELQNIEFKGRYEYNKGVCRKDNVDRGRGI